MSYAMFVLMLPIVRMLTVTSTTLTLQMVLVYGITHVMNTTERWSSERNKSVQVANAVSIHGLEFVGV